MSSKGRSDTPFWWAAGAQTIPARLIQWSLAPIAFAYGSIATRRLNRLPQYHAKIPVICVGNFTAGGTGKTPLVRAICDDLIEHGHTPVILSRGYGGTTEGPRRVDLTRDTAETVGDEPLMLANTYPVLISRNRAMGARFIEAAHAAFKATVIVMDDGLQNPTLAKDLTIAVVDSVRGIGNGRIIPAGPLRAAMASQLDRTDIVALVTPPGARAPSERPHFLSSFRGPVCKVTVAAAGGVAWLKGATVTAYCGIGGPERFIATLEGLGANVTSRNFFADHHPFSAADASQLLARAQAENSILVTTEKDAARLRGSTGPCAALLAASRTVPISATLDDSFKAALRNVIVTQQERP